MTILIYVALLWLNVGKSGDIGKMFKGISNLSIDVKGRASMPQRYRDDFCAKGKCKLVITADKDKCLLIYTQANWTVIEKKLSNLPSVMKENSEAFTVWSSAKLFCCFAHGTANIVRQKVTINNKITTGCIKLIKFLSPRPIEFITKASEFLYS